MTHPVQQITYTKIGTNRKTPRLWIEGVKLSAAGFRRGERYDVCLDGNVLTINRTAAGRRVVSGRDRNGTDIPIIDLEMRGLLHGFNPESRVRVLFSEGTISVTLHHEARAAVDREIAFRKALKDRCLTEASLFTGAGISTLAIHKAITDAGYTAAVKWVVDTELKYLQVGYANNLAITDDTCAIVGRAEEIESAFYTPINILSFSMPCAGFSTAGKSKHKLTAETHDSGTAVFGVVTAIRPANPAVLISENVTEAQFAPAYLLLKAELERLGYAVFEKVLENTDTGTIEQRKRYWFIAISNGLASGFEYAISAPDSLSSHMTINDILESSVPETLWSENQYLKDKAVRDRQAGKGFASRQLLTGEERHCGTIGRHYNKRRSTEPFLVRDDGRERLFTPVEHARLKSVPEEIVAGVPATTAHEVLGQSIDFLQAYLSTNALIAFLEGRAVPQTATHPAQASQPAASGPARQLSLF